MSSAIYEWICYTNKQSNLIIMFKGINVERECYTKQKHVKWNSSTNIEQ